jgi:hypothetical protein
MPRREEILNAIMQEIFSPDNPPVEEIKKEKIKNFIDTTINGDAIKKYLVISAAIKKDIQGILIYILTNHRLIKVVIDEQELNSSSYFLNAIIGIERKLVDSDLILPPINQSHYLREC